ncbi:MAG TPA: ABC transporter permease [Gemmatimonadaceae bacterium]
MEAQLTNVPASHRSGQRVKVITPPSLSAGSLVAGLRGLRDYWDLLLTLSIHRIKVRYKQSALGLAWALIQPLALMLIYTLVFSIFARVKTPGVPYPIFAYAALLPWTFFSTGLTSATNGLVSNTQLVTKVYFPREILPLSYIIAALVDLAVASVVMVGMMAYYHVALTGAVVWVLPVTLILTMLLTSASLVLSGLQVKFRDIGMAMPLVLQLWMFASPVVYPLEQVPARFRDLYMLNPMVGVIQNFRAALLGQALDTRSLLISVIVALVLLPASYVYFKHVEATVADVI